MSNKKNTAIPLEIAVCKSIFQYVLLNGLLSLCTPFLFTLLNHSTRIQTRPKGVPCGHFSTYRPRKAPALLRALRPKLPAIRVFWVAEFSGAEFLTLRGIKRSQSFRIDEAFNKAEAERLPRKSYSYAYAMVTDNHCILI